MSKWKDIDPDDMPGYLIDYVAAWLKERDIKSMNDFNESFQSDSFRDDIEEFATVVVSAVLDSES